MYLGIGVRQRHYIGAERRYAAVQVGENMSASQRARVLLSLGLAAFLVAGCASHTWAPGPDAKGSYDEASAQCSLMARHSGGGFYASGRPGFVIGAALGAAVGCNPSTE